MREVETDRCAECQQLGAEWVEDQKRNLHPECITEWLAGTMQYRARLVED